MIQISNITYFVQNRAIFSGATLQINQGDRIGLVGPNGAGKTTLLKIISGECPIEEGSVSRIKGSTVGFLRQETLEQSVELSVRDVAMKAFDEAIRIELRLDYIERRIGEIVDYEGDEYMGLLDEMQRLHERYAILEGDKKVSKTEEVLEGLGFKTDDLTRPLSEFSGGWRMRVALAKLLLERPDCLLLDEPTNHLDIDSIEWLENYLRNYPGAVVLVSHDKYFLDRMVNRISEVRNRKLFDYPGNYDDYERIRTEQVEQHKREFDSQQKHIEDTERFINRFRAKASKARSVQSRVKALDRMDIIDEPEADMAAISFKFPDPPRSGQVVVKITGLKKHYIIPSTKEKLNVFTSGQELEIQKGDKIALIGPNGAGKSTLARILFNDEPFDGTVTNGHNVISSFFAQHLSDVMTSEATILSEVEGAAKSAEARSQVRGLLGCFLFSGDDVFKPIKVLSGGERSRVALAKTLLEPANFLILDEPTNHLDMRSKQVLVDAIHAYQGTVLVISHDRHFIQGFATKVWRAENGRVFEYEGGFDYYDWKHAQEKEQQKVLKSDSKSEKKNLAQSTHQKTNQTSSIAKDTKKSDADLRNLIHRETAPLKKEIDTLLEKLDRYEKEKSKLTQLMSEPDFYQHPSHKSKLAEFGSIEKKINEITEQWMLKQEAFDKKVETLSV